MNNWAGVYGAIQAGKAAKTLERIETGSTKGLSRRQKRARAREQLKVAQTPPPEALPRRPWIPAGYHPKPAVALETDDITWLADRHIHIVVDLVDVHPSDDLTTVLATVWTQDGGRLDFPADTVLPVYNTPEDDPAA